MIKFNVKNDGLSFIVLTSIQLNNIKTIFSRTDSTDSKMLKSENRTSQTLGTKKAKPIEITLSKKLHQNNLSLNYGSQNLNQSIEKGIRQGLSLFRPLKEKSVNISDSNTLDLKSIKSKQQKLKQEVCPSYKLNWTNTAINGNSSRFSQMPIIMPNQQNTTRQLSHLVKTVEYKKYTKQVQDNYLTNASQFEMTFGQGLDTKNDQQLSITRQMRQGSSNNSVKSKIKGLSKGFLRDGKNVSRMLENEQLRASQMCNQSQSRIQDQSSLLQQSLHQTTLLQDAQKIQQSVSEPLSQQIPIINAQPTNNLTTQQPLPQLSTLKKQYAELQERLEQCVEQIVEIQRNNSVQKIVELENQLIDVKQAHQQQIQHMRDRIQELQCKLAEKDNHKPRLSLQSYTSSSQIQAETVIHTPCPQTIIQYQREISQLRQKVSLLTESLQSRQIQASLQTRPSFELQNQIFETDIIKRKYTTLEQVLESKKKQITNKDSIIQMLLTKQVQKALTNQPFNNMNSTLDKKDKVKTLVCEMIGYMNAKLSAE